MEHYDDLETRSADAREAALLAALPRQIAHAKAKAPGFARILAEVEPAEVTGRQALAPLPSIHKSELVDLQADSPPFGDLTALPPDGFARIFVSPGPIYEPQAPRSDPWRLGLWAEGGSRSAETLAPANATVPATSPRHAPSSGSVTSFMPRSVI